MICHKEKDSQQIKFYFLDSSNLHFLDKNDEQIPDVLENRNRQKVEAGIGLGKNNAFMTKMSIHSVFDQRLAFEIILEIFTG